jgi:hypothetical protein
MYFFVAGACQYFSPCDYTYGAFIVWVAGQPSSRSFEAVKVINNYDRIEKI